MTLTQLINLIYNIVCFLAAVGSEVAADSSLQAVIPAKYLHIIAMVSIVAAIIKGHWNLWINPDGTKAVAPYQPKQ